MALPSGRVNSHSLQVSVSTNFSPLWVRVEYARARSRLSGDQGGVLGQPALILPEYLPAVRVGDLKKFRHDQPADVEVCPAGGSPPGTGHPGTRALPLPPGPEVWPPEAPGTPPPPAAVPPFWGDSAPTVTAVMTARANMPASLPFSIKRPPRKLFWKQFTGWSCLMSTTIR